MIKLKKTKKVFAFLICLNVCILVHPGKIVESSALPFLDEGIVISPEPISYVVESTAYHNPNNNYCYDGTVPVEGLTLAGKKEWVGNSVRLYECIDGQKGKLMGIYEFHDTGFGNDIDGDGVGSIQDGTCIDIFMENYDDCINWGRRLVIMEFEE